MRGDTPSAIGALQVERRGLNSTCASAASCFLRSTAYSALNFSTSNAPVNGIFLPIEITFVVLAT